VRRQICASDTHRRLHVGSGKGGDVREPFEVVFIIGQKVGDAMDVHRRDITRIVSILSLDQMLNNESLPFRINRRRVGEEGKESID
jgi:hypothetical protein